MFCKKRKMKELQMCNIANNYIVEFVGCSAQADTHGCFSQEGAVPSGADALSARNKITSQHRFTSTKPAKLYQI